MDRRSFLKSTGIGIAGLALGIKLKPEAQNIVPDSNQVAPSLDSGKVLIADDTGYVRWQSPIILQRVQFVEDLLAQGIITTPEEYFKILNGV